MSPFDSQLEAAAYRNAAGGQLRRGGSFPLLALLQLASFSAALVACIDGRELHKLQNQAPPAAIAAAVATSAVVGFIAMALGFTHFRSWRTTIAAGAIGALHGPVFLAAFAAPAPFSQAGAGMGVLLLSTILLRVRSA